MVFNKTLQVSSTNNLQHKVDLDLKNFESSKFTKSCDTRTSIQLYVGCVMPLQWTQNKFPRNIIQRIIYFRYSGRCILDL